MLSPEILGVMFPEGNTLPDWDREDAVAMVEHAVETWLEGDLKKYDLTVIETDYANTSYHGIVDLLFCNKETQHFEVVDWKTSKNTLDATWRQRLVDSFQWRMYAELTGSRRVIYRGVNRKLETKFIDIEVPPDNATTVYRQIFGVELMRQAVENTAVWPLNTQSCFAFGRQCPYYLDCQGDTMPRAIVPLTSLSYSQMSDFLLCPERCRRRRLEPQGESDDSQETGIGKAVHRGLAEIYRQAFTLG